jgi:hypothetical protein
MGKTTSSRGNVASKTLTDKVAKLCFEKLTRAEVAEALGISEMSVSNARSNAIRRYGTDLPRFRKQPLNYVRCSIGLETRLKLDEEAKKRSTTPYRLAASILTAVLKDDLINAVLDDGEDDEVANN